ncbi:DoxX family protein [Croceibacterium ferulae]|uniref:DoxX family protein n=1 Tax=Croceibacterium ferulae TaxID=1854641 RepID=UPI000EB07B99|nr:DoxX family protein [Croceibacterium ferulae]
MFDVADRIAARAEVPAYVLLRFGYGVTLATHGMPKLFGLPHGSMADPMAGAVHLIGSVLGLPFAPQLGVLIALLEGVGGTLLAVGLATRLLALAFALQMVGICLALGPVYPWIDRGIEYPILLGLVGLLICARGAGPVAVDRLIEARRAEKHFG